MATSHVQIGTWATATPKADANVEDLSAESLLESRWERLTTEIEGHGMQAFAAGSGAPLVLVHGLLGTAKSWLPTATYLAKGARVFAVDALGIGDSARVPGLDASLRGAAYRLRLWMDSQKLETIDLLGTSHGGAVAMFFAAIYPERVRRLVLSAPANPFCLQSQPQIRFSMTAHGRRLARLIPRAPRMLHAWLHRRMYGDPSKVLGGMLDSYLSSLRIPGTVDYLLAVLSTWNQDMAELQAMFGHLRSTVPTLLLWGDQDRAVSLPSAMKLQAVLEAPLEVLRGLGHLPFEEAPEQFATKVAEFLRQPDLISAKSA